MLKFLDAGYGRFLDPMDVGETLMWTRHPIEVNLIPDGQYWRVLGVIARLPEQEPDPQWKPDISQHRDAAMSLATSALYMMRSGRMWLWDCETTGIDFQRHEIIQIAMTNDAIMDQKDIHELWIRPATLTSHLGGEEVHHISADMLQDKPEFQEVHDGLFTRLHGSIWIGYNISFDASMLLGMCRRHNLLPIAPLALVDVMHIAAQYIGEWHADKQGFRWFALAETARILNCAPEEQHRAGADVMTTLNVLRSIANGIIPNSDIVHQILQEKARERAARQAQN